ncbi:MAG TPA: caspase family protein [Pyrinomonadaceae bacterium]|jgi:hypothetical protein
MLLIRKILTALFGFAALAGHVWIVTATLPNPERLAQSPAHGLRPHAAPRKRALLVGISNYERVEGARSSCPRSDLNWPDLNAATDVEQLELVLRETFGFDEIKVLRTPEETTRRNITGVFRSFLIEQAAPGDIIFFHFSGHGGQVPDDEKHGLNPQVGDELDGLDETLVPSDYVSPCDPSNDIRDDEFGRLLSELRAKKPASITVTMDACHSGSNTRGANTVARGRGWHGAAPTVAPGARREESASGMLQSVDARARGLTVLAASRHDQRALETTPGANHPQMGTFTYALIRALRKADAATTYRDLFERITDIIASESPFWSQKPQLEGDTDALLMSGVSLPPSKQYVEVSVRREQVILAAGYLQGVTAGSQFSIYPAGKDPETSEPLAEAEVVTPQLNTSVLKIVKPAPVESLLEKLRAARAVETRHNYGDMRLKVATLNLDGEAAAVVGRLRELELVNFNLARPDLWDVRICRDKCPDESDSGNAGSAGVKGGFTLQRADGSIIARIPLSATAAAEIKSLIAREARLRFIKGLTSEDDPAVQIRMRLVPVADVEYDPESGLAIKARAIAPEVARTVGGEIELRRGDRVMLELMNVGVHDASVSVLYFDSKGRIGALWPHPNYFPGSSGENVIQSATVGRPVWKRIDCPFVIEIAGHDGWVTFKAVATRMQTNFSPLFQPAFSERIMRGGVRGVAAAESPLGLYLMMATTGLTGRARGDNPSGDPSRVQIPQGWGTATVNFHVRSKD